MDKIKVKKKILCAPGDVSIPVPTRRYCVFQPILKTCGDARPRRLYVDCGQRRGRDGWIHVCNKRRYGLMDGEMNGRIDEWRSGENQTGMMNGRTMDAAVLPRRTKGRADRRRSRSDDNTILTKMLGSTPRRSCMAAIPVW